MKKIRNLGIKIGDQRDQHDPVLAYTKEMEPHWKQLLNAIRLRYPTDEYAEKKPSVPFENMQWSATILSDEYYLSEALAFNFFGKLTLRNNRFGLGMCYALVGLENVPKSKRTCLGQE